MEEPEIDTCLCDGAECGMDQETTTLTPSRDDEEDEEDETAGHSDDESMAIMKRWTLTRCLRSRSCSVCTYLSLGLLLLSSTVSLVVIGIMVVQPYHRVASFKEARCIPVKVATEGNQRKCSCGKSCTSHYPCTQIIVEAVSGKDTWECMIVNDETLLQRQCSYYPECHTAKAENDADVMAFQLHYGILGDNYTCFVNPLNRSEVFRTHRFHSSHVVHGLLWPISTLCFAIVCILFSLKRRGCDFM